MNLDQLQKIAEDAAMLPWERERTDVPFAHRWKFMHDIQPEDVLRLIAVARAARATLSLRDERVHIATTERSAATRTEELLRNGEAAEQAWTALRSALADLDAQQEPT